MDSMDSMDTGDSIDAIVAMRRIDEEVHAAIALAT